MVKLELLCMKCLLMHCCQALNMHRLLRRQTVHNGEVLSAYFTVVNCLSFMAPEYDFRILHFFEFKMFIMFPNLRKLIMNTCCEVLALEIIGLYTNTTAP